ncbi:MAG: hypothetical protein ACOCWG_06360 [bacterium]
MLSESDFFSKYGPALFLRIIQDKDFNFNVFFKNNEVFEQKYDCVSPVLPNKVDFDFNIEAIKEVFNSNWKIFPTGYILTEQHIDFIHKNIKEQIPLRIYKQIYWSQNLLEKYKSDWNWDKLSRLSTIRWTSDLITKFEKKLNFEILSYNSNIELNEKIIQKYEDLWNWNGLSGNPSIANIYFIIFKHPKAVWRTEIGTDSIYNSIRLKDLNNCYADGLNIQEYSEYPTNKGYWPALPEREMWEDCGYPMTSISTNPGINWDKRLFESYSDMIDFWIFAL